MLVIAAPLDTPATRRDTSWLAARVGLVASLLGLLGAALVLLGQLDIASYLLLPAGGLFSALSLVAAISRAASQAYAGAPRAASSGSPPALSATAALLAEAAAQISRQPPGQLDVCFVMLGGCGYTGDALASALRGHRHLLPAASTRVVVLTDLAGPARHVREGGRLRPLAADPLLLQVADALHLKGGRTPSFADAGIQAGWRSMAIAGAWSPDGLLELVERLDHYVTAGRW